MAYSHAEVSVAWMRYDGNRVSVSNEHAGCFNVGACPPCRWAAPTLVDELAALSRQMPLAQPTSPLGTSIGCK